MIGTIKWVVKKKEDDLMHISSAIVFNIEDTNKVEKISNLFCSISFPENSTIEEGNYEAFIHFQDGKDLFCCCPDGTVNRRLHERYCFGQGQFVVDDSKENQIKPIIHVSTINLLKEKPAFQGIPRYAAIMDSSIWNYYFNFEDYYKDDDYNKNHLAWVLSSIAHNTDLGIYDLSIAREYADLNGRLTCQSYLANVMGHGQSVSPFVFHSESKILIKQQELYKKEFNAGTKLRWRFLLIDDKVILKDENDSGCYLSQWGGEPSNKTKTEIIQDRLSSMGFSCCVSQKPSKIQLSDIEIVYTDCIDGALQLMKQYEFDIILLDYLLKDDYGFKLLSEVKELHKKNAFTYGDKKDNPSPDKIIIGPQKKLFVMFISAFTSAVKERLTMEGFSRDEEIWLIGEGACPTNTPELFKYRLLHLMKRRLEQTGISDLNKKEILKIVKYVFPLSPTRSIQDRVVSTKERAYNKYREVLGLHYDYSILKENDWGKSVLVDGFLEKQVDIGETLEHLLQMIHLIAFGTVRQWPEIWEEYQLFVRTINVTKNSDKKTLGKISQKVEEYIIHLKSK